MTKKVIEKYEPEKGMIQTRRVAHFLNWAAIHMPTQWHQYNMILKLINDYPHLPRLESPEVLALKGRMSAVRVILLNTYKRGMVVTKGVGVRATVDDADLLVNDVSKRGEKLTIAVTKFTEVVNLVNQANIPKTKEMAPWLPFLKQSKEAVTTLFSPETMKRLQAPEKKVP